MMPFSCSFRTINLRSSHLVLHLEISGINMRTLNDGKFLLLFPRRPSESGAPEWLWGLKFSFPGFYWAGKIVKYFFGWLDLKQKPGSPN